MQHWSDRFVNVPYEVAECAELIEMVLREKFGRKVRFPRPDRREDVFQRNALIREHTADFARPIDTPYDGCGVILLARNRLAHMGMYLVIDQPYLLHTDSTFGASTRIPMTRVQPPHFRIEGFYAWLDN